MAKAYYIPNGPKNLETLFPMVDFSNVSEYYVQLVDSLDNVIMTTPVNKMCGCESDSDCIRLFFVNSLGAVDGVNFKLLKAENEPKSESMEKPLSYPLDKQEHAIERVNIKSNNNFTGVTIDYNEEQMDWLDELQDSPAAWIAFPGIQGQEPFFMPVVIIDARSIKKKEAETERFYYEYQVEFRYSHEKFVLRN